MEFEIIDRRAPTEEKPYARRVWRVGQVYVKTYATEHDVGFGARQVNITGSWCDPVTFNAKTRGDDPAVHKDAYEFKIETRDDLDAEEKAARMAEDYEAALRKVVAQVVAAVRLETASLPT